MHDSFQPIGGLVPLFNMELGEVTPGGIGAGMYGMLIIGAILAVFIAGLMVGRTPEYLGKKVEAFEIKMAMLMAIVLGAGILGLTAVASVLPEGLAGPLNAGPHGFSEILYAYSSQTANNGSAFAGLAGDTPFYNVTGAFAMLLGRYGMIVPVLALAGSMAAKRRLAPSIGTFPTTGVLWSILIVGVVIVVGALAFFPALALGPIVEQLLRDAGTVFWMSLSRSLLSVDLGRGTRRFQRFVTLGGAKPSGEPPRPRGVLDPDLLRAALPQAIRKLDPRLLSRNPVMFVVEITALLVTLIWAGAGHGAAGHARRRCRLPVPGRHLAVVHGPLRHLRGGRRGGPRPRAGRDAAADAIGDHGPSPPSRRHARGRRLVRASQGRHHRRRGGRDDRR